MDSFLSKDYRKDCRYGTSCYQKNPEHKAKFKHPEPELAANKKEEKVGVEDDKENTENKPDNIVPSRKRLLSSEGDDDVDASKRLHTMSSSEESQEDTEDDAEEKEAEGEENDTEELFDDLLGESSKDSKEDIHMKYLINMPEDFFLFYDFCKTLNSSSPLNALNIAGLKLCGPYDTLADNIPTKAPRSQKLYLTHGRYYYDPPEMTTVVCETEYKTGFHIGYFRDSPEAAPVFVVSGVESEGGKLSVLGDNIFAAVYHHLSVKLDTLDPFQRSKVAQVVEKVKLWVNRAMMEGNSHSLNLEKRSATMKNRDRLKVAVSFHGAGIVVPYNKQTEVGYREIPETPASLRKILKNVVEAETDADLDKALDVLQEIVTNVQFANDEGDPGMGLELGIDLLCYGGDRLHNTIKHLLGVAYELLDREDFAKVANCHLDRRTKGREQDSFARWRNS